jgi:flagellar biosynthesis/type III secretory pathway protein FliH
MSKTASHRLRPKDAAMFAKIGGDFVEEGRYAPPSNGDFVPWGKTSFRVVTPDEAVAEPDIPAYEPDAVEPAPAEPAADAAAHEAEAQRLAQEAEAERMAQAAAAAASVMPPPMPQEAPVNSADIIAEIEKAREDGRVTGYQQGLAAARQELADMMQALRRLEENLVPSTEEMLEKNTVIMARHVRRIAQDLAGNVFSTIPDMFIDRIKKTAEMFTRAGSEFTLAINSKDAQALMPALRGEELFKAIKIVEDPDLPHGGFKLTGRDLEVEDVPEMLGLAEDEQ